MANEVLFEKEGGIGPINVNRPEAGNSLNTKVFLQLNEILDQVGSEVSSL